jgi:hypothetical protein
MCGTVDPWAARREAERVCCCFVVGRPVWSSGRPASVGWRDFRRELRLPSQQPDVSLQLSLGEYFRALIVGRDMALGALVDRRALQGCGSCISRITRRYGWTPPVRPR